MIKNKLNSLNASRFAAFKVSALQDGPIVVDNGDPVYLMPVENPVKKLDGDAVYLMPVENPVKKLDGDAVYLMPVENPVKKDEIY